MIIETKAHTCRKCHSNEIVKNGTNGCGNPQYHCKTGGAYGVLDPQDRYTEEDKERIMVVVYFKVVSDSDSSIQALAVTPLSRRERGRGEGIEKEISSDYRPCYHFVVEIIHME